MYQAVNRLRATKSRLARIGRQSTTINTRAGMSLIEISVIMIVMGVITAIMLPLMSNMFLAVSEKKKARQLSVALGHARNMAIGHNAELIFEFDLKSDSSINDAYEGFILDRSSGKIKREKKIKRTTIEIIGIRGRSGNMIRKGKVAIRFLPGGVAEQTSIYVGDDPNEPKAIVVLDRYLGTARVFENESDVVDYQNSSLINEEWQHDQN